METEWATPPSFAWRQRDVYTALGQGGEPPHVVPLPYGGIAFQAPANHELYPSTGEKIVVYYRRTKADGTLGDRRSALLVQRDGRLDFAPWQTPLKWPSTWRHAVGVAFELRDMHVAMADLAVPR
jgi:hypothetical protein